tara:strand:- start:532 stop:816 length:285 start_codon:yes stop_codon:yes gene_type:complete
MEREPFPYTFPIDFTLYEVGQVFDDAAEDNEAAIRIISQHSMHVDLTAFLSTPIFPVDGTAPTTASTKAALAEGTTQAVVQLTGSPVSKVVVRG